MIRILLAAFLISALVGCSTSGEDLQELENVIIIRAAALNSRDLSRYISVISDSYSDKGKQFNQLKNSLEANFRQYEAISFVAEKPAITIYGSRAEAVSHYRMKVRMRGKEFDFNGTEHLKLVKEPGGWKIIAGI